MGTCDLRLQPDCQRLCRAHKSWLHLTLRQRYKVGAPKLRLPQAWCLIADAPSQKLTETEQWPGHVSHAKLSGVQCSTQRHKESQLLLAARQARARWQLLASTSRHLLFRFTQKEIPLHDVFVVLGGNVNQEVSEKVALREMFSPQQGWGLFGW